MSLLTPTLLATARAAAVALLAVLAALAACGFLRGLSTRALRTVFATTAVVFFTPTMLAGYGWLPTVAHWPAGSVAGEIFYGVMLWVRFTPVAALALWLANPGPGNSARHCAKLTGVRGGRWWRRELGAAPWLAAGVVFLCVFQEFDLATSWGIRTWTVGLFDAQIGGLALGESLQLAMPTLTVELVVIIPLLCVLRHLRPRIREKTHESRAGCLLPLAQVFVGPALFLFGPACFVLGLGLGGFAAWMENFTLVGELAHSLLLAFVCALLAWLIATNVKRNMALALAVPGLLGPLLLSLFTLAIAQPLGAVGRSVLPLVAVLTLQLLPLALLLRVLIRLGTADTALHIARSSGARPVMWSLSHGPAAGAVLLLFGMAYGDFTASALLAPPQFTTVFVRIFNLMHYGQSAVLSASLFIAVAAPLLACWLTHRALRAYFARRAH